MQIFLLPVISCNELPIARYLLNDNVLCYYYYYFIWFATIFCPMLRSPSNFLYTMLSIGKIHRIFSAHFIHISQTKAEKLLCFLIIMLKSLNLFLAVDTLLKI